MNVKCHLDHFLMWRITACKKLESARVVEKTRNDVTKWTWKFSSKSQSVHKHMDITVKYPVYEIFFKTYSQNGTNLGSLMASEPLIVKNKNKIRILMSFIDKTYENIG